MIPVRGGRESKLLSYVGMKFRCFYGDMKASLLRLFLAGMINSEDEKKVNGKKSGSDRTKMEKSSKQQEIFCEVVEVGNKSS